MARLASWEWRPATGEVVIFQALPENGLTGTRAALEALLAGMPAAERRAARDELAAMVRGEIDESVRRYCYELPTGPAWIETSRSLLVGPAALQECLATWVTRFCISSSKNRAPVSPGAAY